MGLSVLVEVHEPPRSLESFWNPQGESRLNQNRRTVS